MDQRNQAHGSVKPGTWIREIRHVVQRNQAHGSEKPGTWIRETRHVDQRNQARGSEKPGTWIRETSTGLFSGSTSKRTNALSKQQKPVIQRWR